MIIEIPAWIMGQLYQAALLRSPNEFCGVLAGPADGGIDRWIEFENIHPNPVEHFAVDTATQLAAWAQLEAAGAAVRATVHSHTDGPPWPSDEDEERHDPSLPMLILHIARPSEPMLRAHFRAPDGRWGQGSIVATAGGPPIPDDPWLWRGEPGGGPHG